ncbi:sti1, partial [Symbiodinium pilosum]
MPADSAQNARAGCFSVLLSCACCLVAAQCSMLNTAARLRRSGDDEGSWLRCVAIDFASGLNAGWLAAATGIGIWQALDLFPSGSRISPMFSNGLVYAVSFYSLFASSVLGGKPVQGFGVGYALATMWAL